MSTTPTNSAATLRVRAMFGLLDAPTPSPAPDTSDALERLDASLRPAQIALITGPSGAGKSTLAAALAQRCRTTGRAVWLDAPPIDPALPVIDLLRAPLARRLRLLAAVGLGDAHLCIRPARALSTGERARLHLALAIDRTTGAPHPATLILDEFASSLDRPGALLLCRLLRRWLERTPRPPRIICVTAHDDLTAALRPELTVRVGPDGRAAISDISRSAPDPSHVIPEIIPRCEIGTFADYTALAHHHYRAGRPAMLAGPSSIRRAIDPANGSLLAVLVVAMPTLNGPWRDIAWPGRYRTPDKAADAARLSRELRCIARVIVDPRYRALGIATSLVRHYLAHPLTPATEAIAAMGAASPFFQAAGMRPYRLPPTPRDARLLDALRHLRLTPAALLALNPPPSPRTLPPLLLRELRAWASHSRTTRDLIDAPHLIAARAAGALLAPPIAYAHVAHHLTAPHLPSHQEPTHEPLRRAA